MAYDFEAKVTRLDIFKWAVVTFAFVPFVRASVVCAGWLTFAVPLGLPAIGIIQAAGFMLLINVMQNFGVKLKTAEAEALHNVTRYDLTMHTIKSVILPYFALIGIGILDWLMKL